MGRCVDGSTELPLKQIVSQWIRADMRQCTQVLVKKPTGAHSLPEELCDGFCLFGDTLVWPAGEPEVPEAAFFSCVQVAQT